MTLRKITLYSAVFAVAAFVLASCGGNASEKAGVKYYRQLQFSETPYDLEKGTHPLTADEAKKVNSYKLTYDESGRLVSVEFVRNDKPLNYGSVQGAAKITYTYEGNKQVKKYWNAAGEQVESGGVYTAEYTLDDSGQRTGLKFFGKDGAPVENRNKIHSWVWTRLPDGMVRELRYNLAGEETIMNQFCPFYELRFSYNDKGFVTRMANYMADTLYNCTAENCGDIGVSYFTFDSNENGDVEKFAVFNATGQMSNLYWGWSKRVTKYDQYGNALETVFFDQDDEYVSGNLIPVTVNTYDETGALVETRNMDKDRNLINHPETGVAITRYKYDEAGNRTETLKFDKNETPVADKA